MPYTAVLKATIISLSCT